MITLTAEQAQQIEEAFKKVVMVYAVRSVHPMALRQVTEALATIRAARAQEQAEQIPQKERQDFIDGYNAGMADAKRMQQAEQEPNYFGLTHDHTWLSIDKKQYDKLKPEGRMACYAAPVRTKDLTDDEIEEIGKSYFDEWSFGFARAVIAADRKLNGIQINET